MSILFLISSIIRNIHREKINNVWFAGEMTNATQTLLKKLEIDIA